MIKNQVLIASDGYEVALYPLESIRITQSYAGDFSHSSYKVKNTGLWDVTGVDGDNPKGYIYAPFSGTIVKVAKGYASGNMVVLASKDKVHLANGKLEKAIFAFGHDNTLDVVQGQEVVQGQHIGNCGNYGYVTGVHSHFMIGTGEWTYGTKIPTIANKNGSVIYYMPNAIDIDDMFFTNGIRKIVTTSINGLTLNWKEYSGETFDITKYKVDRNIYKNQAEIKKETIRVRNKPSLSGKYLGVKMPVGIYNILSTSEADDYVWAKLDTDVYFALTGGEDICVEYGAQTLDLTKYIVSRDASKHQVQVTEANIKVRSSASKPSDDSNYLGVKMPVGIYDVIDSTEADGYTWIEVTDGIYFALVSESAKDLPIESSNEYKEKYEEEVKKYNELDSKYKTLETECSTLKEEKTTIEKELDSTKSELTSVKKELESINSKYTELETKYSNLISSIKSIKTTIDKLV